MSIIEAGWNLAPKKIDHLPENLPVCLKSTNAKVPTRAHPTDAGLDLYSAVDITVGPHSSGIVDTGIAVQIPVGFVGLVYIRSSIGVKYNVTLSNSVGVIDSGYTGTIKIPISNHSSIPFTVRKDDRIAQLVLTPISLATPTVVTSLDTTDRSTGGFGSTG